MKVNKRLRTVHTGATLQLSGRKPAATPTIPAPVVNANSIVKYRLGSFSAAAYPTHTHLYIANTYIAQIVTIWQYAWPVAHTVPCLHVRSCTGQRTTREQRTFNSQTGQTLLGQPQTA